MNFLDDAERDGEKTTASDKEQGNDDKGITVGDRDVLLPEPGVNGEQESNGGYLDRLLRPQGAQRPP